MAKDSRYSEKDLNNLRVLPENLAEGLGSRRPRCWSYIVFIIENKPKNLVVNQRCSWNIVFTYLRLVLGLHANSSFPDVY